MSQKRKPQLIVKPAELTRRDTFALAAVQGLLARDPAYGTWDDLACDAWSIADAMLARRNKGMPNAKAEGGAT
jgi:hypothetical protein